MPGLVADQIKGHLFEKPEALTSVRCRRRFTDYMMLNTDLRDPASQISSLLSDDEKSKVQKERYWLFIRCVSRALRWVPV